MKIYNRNHEHYADPTQVEALCRITVEERRSRKQPRRYILVWKTQGKTQGDGPFVLKNQPPEHTMDSPGEPSPDMRRISA